jgi:hypothetical protein
MKWATDRPPARPAAARLSPAARAWVAGGWACQPGVDAPGWQTAALFEGWVDGAPQVAGAKSGAKLIRRAADRTPAIDRSAGPIPAAEFRDALERIGSGL